jgi:hypothetical protein
MIFERNMLDCGTFSQEKSHLRKLWIRRERWAILGFPEDSMKALWIAILCTAFNAAVLAQTPSNEPPSSDDIILYLLTMHSHDMMQKIMEAQADSMRQLFLDRIAKDKGSVSPDFDSKFKAAMDDLIRNMPADQIIQATIPIYQQHFTKAEIQSMDAFYSSPVGQKALQELPEVMKEGMQAAMPILSAYLSQWQERMKSQLEDAGKSTPKASPSTLQN